MTTQENKALNKEDVITALEKLRVGLQADGGDIELVDITSDNIVKVRFKGACACCPGARMTLKFYIEEGLKETLPQIKEVEMV